MSTFRFLHLTDLHLGMAGQSPLWPNVEEIFLNDLKTLHDMVGPWELVLFTGDLTQHGSESQFDEVEKLLQKFWARFQEWGFSPKLLAIPGNHDLVRPQDESDPALITLLHSWHVPAVQTPFWEKPDSPQRRLISSAFQNFTQWWNNTSIPKPTLLKSGLLPGDCSASLGADGLKLGFVGLNTAYLQLAGGNFERKLHLDARQLHAVCDGNAADWARRHDACLLFTHHPVEWLTDESKKQFSDEIHYPPERFALHLFGHRHEANLTTQTHGGGSEKRRLQGSSLFGLEHWGEQNTEREHGYSLCELKQEGGALSLRIWPRCAVAQQGGGRKIVRDESFDLIEQDGGTRPIVVKPSDTQVFAPQLITRSSDTVATYDPRNPPFYVPYRQKGDQVIGRDEALEAVRRQLSAGRRTAIGQTAVFQGMGGLGKTQLAVEYAYRYRADYPNGVIWLTADQDLDAQLVDLAVKARWVAPESEHKFKLEIARHRLRSYSDCLIVFDNLEQLSSIQDYLPEPPAEPHILVTSRTEQPDFTYVPINVLNDAQSLQLLLQEAGRQPDSEADWVAAREISNRLGGLPLALEMAGAYLARRLVGWQQYLELLQHNLKQALPNRMASWTRHEADLYSTLQVSSEVFSEEPSLQDILDVLTWSAPAPMSVDLLAALVGVGDRSELTGALGLGTALRLLQQTPGTEDYAIHRLVREVRREQNPLAEKSAWAADLCQRVGDWFHNLREDFQHLPRFEANIDHLREWHNHALQMAPQRASRLTWLQAYPPYHRAQFQELKRLIELALDEYEKQNCDDRPLLAHLYNDLAYSLGTLGEPKRALGMAERALTIRRELFGEQHSETARSLGNVAQYTADLGDSRRALELAERAYTVHCQLFGKRHSETARSLSSIAHYTDDLGDPKRALELAEQALAIRREVFTEKHPEIAGSFNDVAEYLAHLGDPSRALRMVEQALSIQLELFGERHPATALSLNDIAVYTDALGNTRHALEVAARSLAIRREIFGERHRVTAVGLHNIAGLLMKLGRTVEAFKYAQEAFEIERQVLGAGHPKTLGTAKLLSQIKRPGFRVPSSKTAGGSHKKNRKR